MEMTPFCNEILAGPASARAFFTRCFADADPTVESLFVAHLDSRGQCIHLTRHDGDLVSTALPLRTILLDAARNDTRGVVVAHNHPSGDPMPSASDCAATRRLATAGAAIDVTLVDHLVFGGEEVRSFKSLGLL